MRFPPAAAPGRSDMSMKRVAPAGSVAVLAAALGAACGGGGSHTRTAGDWSGFTELATDTVGSIGGAFAEGAAALARVTDVVIGGANADVIVADARNAEIRVFDISGTHLRSLGRKGKGPGEFDWITSLSPIRDGIAAWDGTMGRLTTFREDGSVDVAHVQVPVPHGKQFSLVGAFNDGSVAVRVARSEMLMRGAPEGTYTDTLVFVRIDPATNRTDTLASLVTAPSVFYDGESSWGFMEQVFGSGTHAAVGDDVLFFGTGDQHAVESVTTAVNGQRLSANVLPPSGRTLTSELIAAERERRLRAVEERYASMQVMQRGSNVTGQITRTAQDVVASLAASELAPVFDRLVAEGDSVLWLRRRPLDDTPAALWLRLSLLGAAPTRVMLPATEELVAARFPWFVVQGADDLDAPVLRIHEIRQDS
jgi:hypothetical protein